MDTTTDPTTTRPHVRQLYRDGVARVSIGFRTTDEQVAQLLAFYTEEYPQNVWTVR